MIHTLVETDLSATAALKQFRAAGGHMATGSWYRMWGEVENERALGGIEYGRPLHLKPTTDEILTMTTRRASGYMQRVQVFGRTVNGDVISKTIDVRGDSLIARKNAITKAENIVKGIESSSGRDTGSLPVQVLGGVYGGTFELIPE